MGGATKEEGPATGTGIRGGPGMGPLTAGGLPGGSTVEEGLSCIKLQRRKIKSSPKYNFVEVKKQET